MLSHLIFITPLGIGIHNSRMDKYSQASLASGFGVMSIWLQRPGCYSLLPSYPMKWNQSERIGNISFFFFFFSSAMFSPMCLGYKLSIQWFLLISSLISTHSGLGNWQRPRAEVAMKVSDWQVNLEANFLYSSFPIPRSLWWWVKDYVKSGPQGPSQFRVPTHERAALSL